MSLESAMKEFLAKMSARRTDYQVQLDELLEEDGDRNKIPN